MRTRKLVIGMLCVVGVLSGPPGCGEPEPEPEPVEPVFDFSCSPSPSELVSEAQANRDRQAGHRVAQDNDEPVTGESGDPEAKPGYQHQLWIVDHWRISVHYLLEAGNLPRFTGHRVGGYHRNQAVQGNGDPWSLPWPLIPGRRRIGAASVSSTCVTPLTTEAGAPYSVSVNDENKPLGVDLSGKCLTFQVYCEKGTAGSRSAPNGIQPYLKSVSVHFG